MTRLDDLLHAAAEVVPRLEPTQAFAAMQTGSMLVDIRSQAARSRDGVIPGSVHVPRTVVEWRLDPEGASRSPHVPAAAPVMLICDHGYSSLLSAATLRELGADASDVIGGFVGWRDAGLPWIEHEDPPLGPDEPQGIRGPIPAA